MVLKSRHVRTLPRFEIINVFNFGDNGTGRKRLPNSVPDQVVKSDGIWNFQGCRYPAKHLKESNNNLLIYASLKKRDDIFLSYFLMGHVAIN